MGVIFETVHVDLDQQVVTGLVPKLAFDLLFRIADEEESLTRLCEAGRKICLERERRGWHYLEVHHCAESPGLRPISPRALEPRQGR